MGLGITAYSGLDLIEVTDVDTWEKKWGWRDDGQYGEATFFAHPAYLEEPQFPEQIADCDLVAGGVYRYAESYGFRAGSYSGYNAWRALLSQNLLGYATQIVWQMPDVYREKPFYFLVNFADNEGYIAGPAADRLAADFVAHQDAAARVAAEYFLTIYNHFRHAFELAADHGVVDFH